MSGSIAIGVAEIEKQLDKNCSIEDRLKKAMKLALNHWLISNENDQFLSAVIAVLNTASEEEKITIKEEMTFLKGLSAAAGGVPVDFGALVEGKDASKWYGLQKLWKDAKRSCL